MSLSSTLNFIRQHPLNRNNPTAAIWRFLKWQVVSRLRNGAIAMPFANHTELLVLRGMTGATGNIYCGLHEVDDMGFLLHTLRDSDQFVDVGANIGSYTILASGVIGAKTIAFEPASETFPHLATNVTHNGIGNLVELNRKGVSDQNGRLQFSIGSDTTNAVVNNAFGREIQEIEVVRLDNAVRVDRPTLLKIDVEGHEDHVLDGASETLSNERVFAVIMECNGSENSNENLKTSMTSLGFSCMSYDAISRKLISYSNENNAIFIRDIDLVENRIGSAPKIQLPNGTI